MTLRERSLFGVPRSAERCAHAPSKRLALLVPTPTSFRTRHKFTPGSMREAVFDDTSGTGSLNRASHPPKQIQIFFKSATN
ncbi:unnamed protein product [Tilletia caries]|uniref:Uncharacterized protein n=1 Tax=Tilletia caries TaxID=13290 RepID=A0ABN7IXU4_9BASI|nr:unnamed protein product [Tilletia caries]